MTADFDRVAAALRASKRAVYLTGAGISVASGITPYRSGPDAVWANFIMDWGTIERFHLDPRAWYREFWIKAHPTLLAPADHVQPNAAHHAIARLLAHHLGHRLITQNIDGLHRRTSVESERLIEIHGRHDLFVCSDAFCSRGRSAVPGFDLNNLAGGDGDVPGCNVCGAPLRPHVLLFDEMYDSQPAYRAREARTWLNDADVVVFCGTSFSVGITAMAVQAARYSQALMVNVNPVAVADAADLGFINLQGKSEELLPALADAVTSA
jgi:NAD-dependent deacetylase